MWLRSWTLVVVMALLTSACVASDTSSGQLLSSATDIDQTSSTTVQPTTVAPTTAAPTTTTSTTSPPTTLAPDPHETLIATARSSITQLLAYDAPDGDLIALPFSVPNPHQFGGPLTLMVTEGEIGDEWVQVQLPIRPNESVGWVPAEDYVFHTTRIRAEIDLATTSVKVFDGDEMIAESQAAIGTARTPTPLGTFYIAAKRRNPPAEAYLGTHALILSSFSETLESFSGGLPVIAIHGTNNPGLVLGRAVSNGCVRIPNEVIEFMAENVPIGAPVTIIG